MLRVYLNGDSQTIGSDLPWSQQSDDVFVGSYADHLVHHLGGEIIANPAVGGGSNDRIMRTTNQMLDDCERNTWARNPYPDFIVIGWTEWSRYDWFYNGKYRSMHAAQDGLSIEETALEKNHPRAEWQKWILSDARLTGTAHVAFYYNQMMNLHLRLEYLKIPHLFFNAHAGFYDEYGVEHRGNTMAVDLFEEFDWQNCFWNVFEREDASFTSWSGKRGYKDVLGWHYEHQAHIDFGKVMYDYIQEHDLLNMYNSETV